jgi:hypothetical protein
MGLPEFDCGALIDAVDAQREAAELEWSKLADVLHQQSADLNAKLADHALCPGALVRIAKRRRDMTCQYALILLRWVRSAPEDFLTGDVKHVGDTSLPRPTPDKRLRWNLPQLHAALNDERRQRALTWTQLAEEIGCTPSRLTNLRTARLADMNLVMRITQWLGQPAATFVHPADW